MTQQQFNTLMTAINPTNAQRGFNGYHIGGLSPDELKQLRDLLKRKGSGGGNGGGGRGGGNTGGGRGAKRRYEKEKMKVATKMITWVAQSYDHVRQSKDDTDRFVLPENLKNGILAIAKQCNYRPTDDWVAEMKMIVKNLNSHDSTTSKLFLRAIDSENAIDGTSDVERELHLEQISFFLMLLLSAHKFEKMETDEKKIAMGLQVEKYLHPWEMKICKSMADRILQICFHKLFEEGQKGFNTNPFEKRRAAEDGLTKGSFNVYALGPKYTSVKDDKTHETQIIKIGSNSTGMIRKVHVHLLFKNDKNNLKLEFYAAAKTDPDFAVSYKKLPDEKKGFAKNAIEQLLRENLMFVDCYSEYDESDWTEGGETFDAAMKDFNYGNLPYSVRNKHTIKNDAIEMRKLKMVLQNIKAIDEETTFSDAKRLPVNTDLHGLSPLAGTVQGVMDPQSSINPFLAHLNGKFRRTSMLSWD